MSEKEHFERAEDFAARAYELPGMEGGDISADLLAQLALVEALLAIRDELKSLKVRIP